MSLAPYMGFVQDAADECAVLVFAHNAREAKPLSFAGLAGFFDVAYPDVRVRRIRKHVDYIHTLGDATKLAEDRAHVIDAPPGCECCTFWTRPIADGARLCDVCAGGEA